MARMNADEIAGARADDSRSIFVFAGTVTPAMPWLLSPQSRDRIGGAYSSLIGDVFLSCFGFVQTHARDLRLGESAQE